MYVVPSSDHPIYAEWKKWRHKQEANWSIEGSEAMKSIERIAAHIYADHPSIVGFMIMKDDLEEMAKESRPISDLEAKVLAEELRHE